MKLMKTSEFAHLCRTTKDTLIHYDRIDILKPARVTDAGYRLYRPEQFFFFSVIALLQQADMSLADIRSITNKRHEGEVLQVIEERTMALQHKIKRLEAADQLMRAITAAARETAQLPQDILSVIERNAVPLRAFIRPQPADWSDETSVATYAACYDWDENHGGFGVPPAGEIVKEASLVQGLLVLDAIYSPQFSQPVQQNTDSGTPVLMNRAAGRWAVLRRRVKPDEMPDTVATFLTAMQKNHLTGTGDLWVGYEYNYLFPGDDPERFDVMLSRQIA